jgi:hypothetical protein
MASLKRDFVFFVRVRQRQNTAATMALSAHVIETLAYRISSRDV